MLAVDASCNHRLFIDAQVVRPLGDNNGCRGGLACQPRVFGERNDESPFLGYQPKNGAASCGPNGALEGWGNSQYKLRIGKHSAFFIAALAASCVVTRFAKHTHTPFCPNHNTGPGFYGSVNNLALWQEALPTNAAAAEAQLARRIWREQPLSFWASAVFAFDFDGGNGLSCSQVGGPGCAVRDVSSGAAVTAKMADGAFRGLLLAIPHDWANCPGVDYFHPESPCNTDIRWSGGRCYKEDIFDLTHHCDCLPGFFGTGCTDLCPGLEATGRACSGNGECFELNSTLCVCNDGYQGAACQYECPGWSAEWNVPQRLCSGYGSCNVTSDGTGAECVCEPTSNRYGDACQYINGAGPDQIIQAGCESCVGQFEECVDGVCRCAEAYYRVFGDCKKASSASVARTALASLLAAALAMLVAA